MYWLLMYCGQKMIIIHVNSPGYGTDLPYRSPYLPDKIIFWAFLCLGLKLSPFLAENVNFSYSQYGFWAFLHVFNHWQRLFLAWKQWLRFLIVRTSCKTSFIVLSHSHWGRKKSLQILDLQRLASLCLCRSPGGGGDLPHKSDGGARRTF